MNDHIIDEYKIFLYSEGELEDKEKDKVSEHLDECPDCRNIYEDYLKQKELTKIYFTNIARTHSPGKNSFRFTNKVFLRYAALSIILLLVIFFLFDSTDKVTIMNTPPHQTDNNIFDTQSWTQELYTIEIEIETFRQQIEDKPF